LLGKNGQRGSGRMIRWMEKEDIREVVRIHLASFPGFFLSFLGPRFLALYYSGVRAAPEGIALVFLNPGGEPAGFVAGTTNPRGFYSRLLKRGWPRFVLASLGPMLRKPSVVGRIARALSHPSRNPVGEEVAGLFSIGVLPELQGTGAGRKLVDSFLSEARKRGCRRVFLTTDRNGNDAGNAFYRKLGFRVERQFETPEGRAMNEYWIDLA